MHLSQQSAYSICRSFSNFFNDPYKSSIYSKAEMLVYVGQKLLKQQIEVLDVN